jgi:hypothetical protein
LVTWVPDWLHAVTEGVQTLSLHDAVVPVATHTCEPHETGCPNPLPSERQVTTALVMHEVELAVQTSGAQVPILQNWSGLQSVAPTHCTQMP